jgi:hypothetical protein
VDDALPIGLDSHSHQVFIALDEVGSLLQSLSVLLGHLQHKLLVNLEAVLGLPEAQLMDLN